MAVKCKSISGKECIAICGYHGWHDWYLATNIESKSKLNEHLLPGLEPLGVPTLEGSTFKYNNIEELRSIIKNKLAIKMEWKEHIHQKITS